MMRLKKLFFLSVFMSAFILGCSNDDDDLQIVPPRDMGEQAIADEAALQAYLQTHFYNEEEFRNPPEGFDYVVKFDTIAGDNSNKTPLIDSDLLTTKVVTRNEVDYNVHVLKVREGEGASPTFADSAYVKYQGTLINGTVFDANIVVPIWFDFPGKVVRGSSGQAVLDRSTLPGFVEAVTEFKEASGFTVNTDNTINWNNDFGIGAVFMPSGLAYFNSPPQGSAVPPYSPLIFSFNLMRTVEADHDNDGIPSWMEDLDGDGDLLNDDTDGDGIPDYSDPDDDGDGTPTRREIIIRADGTIDFPDSNGNGKPNYLDPTFFEGVS